MTTTIRRFTAGDEDALAAIVARARDAGELLGSSTPHGEWMVRFATHQPGQVAVAVVDGTVVGAVFPEMKALVVEPAFRRRGLGRGLVEEGLAIERERGRPNLLVGALPDDVPGRAFLVATGFAYHSTLWDLDLPPGAAAAPPAWPDGLAARTIDRTRDLPAFVALFNAAFADHATPLQLDQALIEEDWADSPFRDEDLLLLEDASGALAGFSATEPKHTDDGVEPRGEIWTIGVRPELQGRGLGRQLLRWGIGHLREAGVETVFLSVNARNPRALGLYESEGFVRTATRDRWARPVEAGAPETRDG